MSSLCISGLDSCDYCINNTYTASDVCKSSSAKNENNKRHPFCLATVTL